LSPDVKKELDKAPPSPAFQQFLIRYLDLRDSVIINFISDNDKFADKIANKVYDQFAETFKPFQISLEKIENGILKINERLNVAEERVNIEEKRIEEHEIRLNKKREAIKELRTDFEKYKEDVVILAEIKPTLLTLQKAFGWWNRKNWWKIAGIVFGIILVFSLLVVGITFYMHRVGWVTYGFRHSQNNEWVKQVHEGQTNDNGTVRAIHFNDLTANQRDSITKMNQQEQIKAINR
jgi:hypothetical protein